MAKARGVGILLTPTNIYSTLEFNDKMDPDTYGYQFLNDLRKVKSVTMFRQMHDKWLQEFDCDRSIDIGFDIDRIVVPENDNVDNIRNHVLNLNPYPHHSEWLYVKNLSGDDYTLKLQYNQTVIVPHSACYALHFGTIPADKYLKTLNLWREESSIPIFLTSHERGLIRYALEAIVHEDTIEEFGVTSQEVLDKL